MFCVVLAVIQMARAGAITPALGQLMVGLMFTLMVVGSFPPLMAIAQAAALRGMERSGSATRQRVLLVSLGVGGLLGALPLLSLLVVPGGDPLGIWTPVALAFLAASLAGGYVAARIWAPGITGRHGPMIGSPSTGGMIGAAVGWTAVYWGLLMWGALTGRLGNLSGFGEMFYAIPAAALGGFIGALLSSVSPSAPGQSKTGVRLGMSPALVLWGSLALLVGWGFLRLTPSASQGVPHSLDPQQEQAAVALRKLGGGIQVDPSRPEKPVVAVYLAQDPVTDTDLTAVASFPRLRELNLDMTRITDAGLVHLRDLTELRELQLAAVRVQGPGLEHLRKLQNLHSLSLGASRVGDAGLAHLSGLTGLQELYLFQTGISDQGVAHLRGLKRLHTLDLTGTRVTDAGLPHFYGLARLRELRLRNTAVTDAGVRTLKKKLPEVRIVRVPAVEDATRP